MSRKRVTNEAHKKEWHAKAIAAAAAGASVTACAKAAGVNRLTIYRHIDADPEFKKAFDDAIEQGTDVIEDEATLRATHGVDEPVIYQGKLTFVGVDKDGNSCDPTSPLAVKNVPLTIRKPSDTLAIFLLKARRPAKYRENVDITTDGKAIDFTLKIGTTGETAGANGNGRITQN